MHWVVHGRVAPGESDDIIGEVLGRIEASERLAGALWVEIPKGKRRRLGTLFERKLARLPGPRLLTVPGLG